MQAPTITDHAADRRFRDVATAAGKDPDSLWVGGYVAYEWQKSRHLAEAYTGSLRGQKVLEFGCNFGSTSVILSHLGASVTGIDLDQETVELARLNAERFAARDAAFAVVSASGGLPFADQSFDLISCNSVLEYVEPAALPSRLREFDRLLKPGGILLVMGTSNRLAPCEVHSGRWLVNYLPRSFDRFLGLPRPLQRGIWPWLRRHLPEYHDLVRRDGGQSYLIAKQSSGLSPAKLLALQGLGFLADSIGMSAGMLVPSFFRALQKPELQT